MLPMIMSGVVAVIAVTALRLDSKCAHPVCEQCLLNEEIYQFVFVRP